MRVFIDATGLTEPFTGLTNYSINLLREMVAINQDNQFTVLCSKSASSSLIDFLINDENVSVVYTSIPNVGPLRDLKYLSLYPLINKHDLYHCLSSYLPFFRIKATTLITIHDLKYLKINELMNSKLKTYYLKFILKRSLIKADKIIAISQSTASDIADIIGDNHKTAIVYEANTLDKSLCKSFEKEVNKFKFFLCIGENRTHKNYVRVIKAYEKAYLSNKIGFPDLYIAGNKVEELSQLVDEMGLEHKVTLLGLVSNEKILWLYHHAFVFLYVSLYEGFGLPLLEAMSCGLPIITSDCHSTKEISGGAAYLVNPKSINDISEGMCVIYSNDSLRESYKAKGIDREMFFSWTKAAKATKKIYEELCK